MGCDMKCGEVLPVGGISTMFWGGREEEEGGGGRRREGVRDSE